MASLIGQVDYIFDRLSRMELPDPRKRSRHREKVKIGKPSRGVASYKTRKRYQQIACHFVRQCHELYDLKWVCDITVTMVKTYILTRQATLSPRTVAAELCALRKLAEGALRLGWIKTSFVPETLRVACPKSPRFGYTPDRADAIIERAQQRSPEVACVLQMQMAGALRLEEVTKLRIDKIDWQAGIIEVKGKNGRVRQVELQDKKVLQTLNRAKTHPLMKGAEKTWRRKIEQVVRDICVEMQIEPLGTHGLRATGALKYMEQLVEQGVEERDARKQLSRYLGHNRTSVTFAYVL